MKVYVYFGKFVAVKPREGTHCPLL